MEREHLKRIFEPNFINMTEKTDTDIHLDLFLTRGVTIYRYVSVSGYKGHDTIYRFRLLNDDTYLMLISTCQFAVCVISRSSCVVER